MTTESEVINGVLLAADLDPIGPRPMIAILDAKPDRIDDLRQLVADLADAVRREPGCIAFVAYQEHGSARRFYLHEVYRDLDAFRTHLRTSHVRHFVDTAPGLCTSDTSRALVQLDQIRQHEQ